jgi:hypothetical protein
VKEEGTGFVLDAVVEGVPSPRSAEAGSVWPRVLVEAWSPTELPRAREEDETDPRRAWHVKDPQGDLELTIIWAPGPGDPVEAEKQASLGNDASAADEEGGEGGGAEPEAESEGGDDGEADGEPRKAPEGWLLFGHTPRAGNRSEDLLRVCELALRMAEQLGLRLFDPVLNETFMCEDWAYRLTEPFHARGYVATHFVRGDGERPSWVHTHGMDRFGLPDVEAFSVPVEDAEDVVAFLHEAAESWIREDPPAPSAQPRRVDGVKVRVLDARVARRRVKGYDESAWEGHDTPYFTIAPLGEWKDTLAGWRPSSVRRSPLLVERLCAITNEILPQIKKRFEKGQAAVKVKARFPIMSSKSKDFESMWVHVEEWDEHTIKGRLDNEPERRSDLACGSTVEVADAEVWDVLVVQDGRPYRGVSLRRWLRD